MRTGRVEKALLTQNIQFDVGHVELLNLHLCLEESPNTWHSAPKVAVAEFLDVRASFCNNVKNKPLLALLQNGAFAAVYDLQTHKTKLGSAPMTG